MKAAHSSETSSLHGKGLIKSAMLITVGVFLISAPAPDARVIAEMTSNLIVIAEQPASEVQSGQNPNT